MDACCHNYLLMCSTVWPIYGGLDIHAGAGVQVHMTCTSGIASGR